MSQYNPHKHHRRSIRLKNYDYSQEGLYFLTLCVQKRAHLFGKIVNGIMLLNDAGKMVEEEWLKLPDRFPNIQLHEFVVMPNHFHAILEIVGVGTESEGATLVVARVEGAEGATTRVACVEGATTRVACVEGATTRVARTVGDMLGAFKSIVTVEYIRGVKTLGWHPFDRTLWQRNYWEHIIRNEQAYQNISNYIENNPAKWDEDKFYKK